MAGKKKSSGQRPPSPQPSPPGEGVVIPEILEYKLLTGEVWRVDAFHFLAVEFEFKRSSDWPAAMAAFHEVALGYQRGWQFTRELFGIAPLLNPGPDFKVYARAEVCERWQLEPDDLAAELKAVRALWDNKCKKDERKPDTRRLAPEAAPEQSAEEFFKSLGFSEEMFQVSVYDANAKDPATGNATFETARPDAENLLEKKWFLERITAEQWKLMLSEPMSSVVARSAVLAELDLRRLDAEMSRLSSTSSRYQKLEPGRDKLSDKYQKHLDKLQEMFPDRSIASKMASRATIAGIVKAVQDYYADGDNHRVDGLRTIHEIDVDLTGTAQSPLPSYRLGQSIWLLQSFLELHNPNYRPKLRPQTIRKLDLALPECMEKARAILNEKLVNLEHGVLPGEGDDFPDFPVTGGETTDAERVANL